MIPIDPFFVVPVVLGALLLSGSLLLVRREALHPRQFGLAVLLSIGAILSPGLYITLDAVSELLGFVYTFVLAFALSITVLLGLVVYLLLLVGQLRQESEALWQEMALLRAEADQQNAPEHEP